MNNHGWLINMQTNQQWSQLMSVCQLMPDVVFRALVIQCHCVIRRVYVSSIFCVNLTLPLKHTSGKTRRNNRASFFCFPGEEKKSCLFFFPPTSAESHLFPLVDTLSRM